MRRYSAGFAEPILWGRRRGYTVTAIADGLELHVAVVLAVLMQFSSEAGQ